MHLSQALAITKRSFTSSISLSFSVGRLVRALRRCSAPWSSMGARARGKWVTMCSNQATPFHAVQGRP